MQRVQGCRAGRHLIERPSELPLGRGVPSLAPLVVPQLPTHGWLEQRPRLPPLALHDEDGLRVLVRVQRRGQRRR